MDDTLVTGAEVPVEADDEWLEAPPPVKRRRLAALTFVLLLALVAVGAFILGVEVQKRESPGGAAQTGAPAAAFASGRGNASAVARRGALAGGNATLGQVKTISGSSLYVTSFTGNVVKVKTSASTRVTKTEQLTVHDVKPGDTVVIQGTQAKDGSITAASISLGGVGGA